MRHQYHESLLHEGKCTICNKDEISHGPEAECDICGSIGPCEVGNKNLLYCLNCAIAEAEADRLKRQIPANVLTESRKIDESVRIQTDIFNAKTIAINELKIAIDADTAVVDKHFTLARALDERYTHLKEVIFSKRNEITEAESEQRAINTYYNELAKKLRAEERERIKIKDAAYTPKDPVKVVSRKAPVVKKYDKVGIYNASQATGIPEQIIQMTCVVRNVEPLEAVRLIHAQMSKVAESEAK